MRRNAVMLIACLASLWTLPARAAIDVNTVSLGHGVEAWFAPSQAVPVVDVILSFEGAGSASDPAGKAGLAAFTAAMLNEGAGDVTSQAFSRQLDAHAITLEARADNDRITVHVYCLREHAQKAGELLALTLSQPNFAEPDMARVKAQFASLLSSAQENPNYLAERALAARVFSGHPYANPVYGTAGSIAGLTAADARAFLHAHIARSNVIVAAAGDVDARVINAMVRPAIDALEANAEASIVPQAAFEGAGDVLHAKLDVPQTVIAFAGPGVARDDPRFYAAYLLNEILGGGTLTSRLGNEVRQKQGLVYSIDTDLEVRQGGTLLAGQLATRNSTADRALAQVKTVLADIQAHGVTAEECNDAKSYVLGHFPLQLDRTGSVSAMLFTMQLYHLGEHYMQDRVRLFTQVTCADINAAAAELLKPERFVFSAVGGVSDAGAPEMKPAKANADAR